MSIRLSPVFYAQNAVDMAPALLGKLLCRQTDSGIQRLHITETECYHGESDTACHAHKGRTPRTQMLYQAGGTAYVYLCYGIHNLFNVVAGTMDFPEAVLIRGVAGYIGPGRLTKALSIDRSLNGEVLYCSERLWLEDDGMVVDYQTAPRVGIGYASLADQARLWRFRIR